MERWSLSVATAIPPPPRHPSLYDVEQNSKLMKKTSFKVPVVLSTLVLLELCDKSRWRCLEKQTDFASRGLYGKTIKISKLKFLFVSRDMNSEFQTLLITATALLCHVQRIYPIGAGGDAWLDYYQPNFTSVCFVLGVSLLLSSKELWPSALRRPSQPVLFCYLVRRKQQSQLKMGQRPQSPPDLPSQFCALVSAFTVSVTLRTVWLPLTLSIAKSNFWMARKIKTTKALKKFWLLKMSRVLESQTLQNLEVTLVAIVFLHYSLKVSGVYTELLQTAFNTKNAKPCIGKAKSDFSPRISDSFIPFAVRRKH
ncbi:hypothetical protein RUM43_001580 [Polyplax serrata]|uniref:Uncharacterized protein n=1 Tax=Polyplax serrata TaxID=468196 RepID=A0AAN8SFM8_POLSC